MIYTYFDPLNLREEVDLHSPNYVALDFKAVELGCQCCGMIRLAVGFIEQLVVLRKTYGMPMLINSACRCASHNTDIGGHPNSAHICDIPTKHSDQLDYGACGVDVANPTEKLIKTAMALGWSVGIAQHFVHLDRIADYSMSKTYQRLFYYSEVSLGPREYWSKEYNDIQLARKTLGYLSWEG